MYDLTADEQRLLKKLRTPALVQDFLNELPMNDEANGDTCFSPRMVMREKSAHCMEGAMLAAAALRLQGRPPIVLDLTAAKNDFDHVVALFKENNRFGAISKTNHAVLRYREPVYASVRELVMSYFHEYFLDDGTKTLRSYSRPVDLSRFDSKNWMTSEEDVWFVPEYLADVPHVQITTSSQRKKFRKADRIERDAGALLEWKALSIGLSPKAKS